MSRLEEIKRVNSKHIKQHYGTSAVPTEDFKWLIQRVEELENANNGKVNLLNKINKLKKENQRYKQALEFYANENNYIHDEWKPLNPNAKSIKMSQVEFDDGEKARQALKGEFQ